MTRLNRPRLRTRMLNRNRNPLALNPKRMALGISLDHKLDSPITLAPLPIRLGLSPLPLPLEHLIRALWLEHRVKAAAAALERGVVHGVVFHSLPGDRRVMTVEGSRSQKANVGVGIEGEWGVLEERGNVLERDPSYLSNIDDDHVQPLLMINLGSRDDSMEPAELNLPRGIALASNAAVQSGGRLVFPSQLRVLV